VPPAPQLLWLYSLIALSVFLATVFSRVPALSVGNSSYGKGRRSQASQLDLAQSWLTSPLPLVADLFAPDSASLRAQLSRAHSPMGMFEESAETARLAIGLDGRRYPAYGLRRRFSGEDEEEKI